MDDGVRLPPPSPSPSPSSTDGGGAQSPRAHNNQNRAIDIFNIVAQFGKSAHASTVHDAVYTCKVAWIQEPLWSGLARVQSGAARRSHLMFAAWKGDAARVQWLLARSSPDAQLELADARGWTALAWAAFGGGAEAVRCLVGAGARVNSRATRVHNGETPLTLAAVRGHEDAVAALLAAPDIDVNASSDSGWTALMFAERNGHASTSALLRAHGATAYDRRGDLEIAKAWCRPLHNISAGMIEGDINTRGVPSSVSQHPWCWTLLMHAAHAGDSNVACALIRAGADVNARSAPVRTPCRYTHL